MNVFEGLLYLIICTSPALSHKSCGTATSSKHELDFIERKIKEATRKRSGFTCTACINIETYIYVFHRSDGEGSQANQLVIEEQIDFLNNAFSKTPFQFKVANLTFVVDDVFHDNLLADYQGGISKTPEMLLKRWPRKGDYSTLNIYFGGVNMPFSFSFLPSPGGLAKVPWDGAYVFLESVPKVYSKNQTGATTVHEVGHWLGLLHVFQSTTKKVCDPKDKNDYVLDTPQMADFVNGTDGKCPSDLTDTCKFLPGADPIHNYMDYSSDLCMNEFTSGQIERMFYIWSIFRKPKETCSKDQRLFELEILTDENPDETFWILQTGNGTLIWNSRPSENGLGGRLESGLLYTQDICLDNNDSYIFTIHDRGRNGLISPGYYIVRFNGNNLNQGSDFGRVQTTYFNARNTNPPNPTESPSLVLSQLPTTPLVPSPQSSKSPMPLFNLPSFANLTYSTSPTGFPTILRDPSAPSEVSVAPFLSVPAIHPVEIPSRLLNDTTFPNPTEAPSLTPAMPAIYPFHTSSPSLRNGQLPSNNLTPTSSLSPVDTQVPVESIISTPAPSPSIYCFSGKSKVLVQNVGWVMIHHINLGDRVLVRKGIYEEVYSFGHHNKNASGNFIQLFSNASKEPIEISSHHLILLRENRWVPASAIRIGDILTTGEGNQVVVNRIVHKVGSGLFAPFTKSGSIVINNIVASNFISLQESEYLTIGGLETPFSYQWLAFNFETIHRMSCRMYSCRREKYSYEGISYWVYMPFRLSDFFLSLHPIVTMLFFLPILFLFGAVSIFTFPIPYLLPFVVCTVIISNKISRKKFRCIALSKVRNADSSL